MEKSKDIRIFELKREGNRESIVNQRYGTFSDFNDPLVSQLIVQHSDYIVEEFRDESGGGWFSILDSVEFPHNQYTIRFETDATKYQTLAHWIQDQQTLPGIICVSVEIISAEASSNKPVIRPRGADIQRRVDLIG